jgi:uronate dehydrogenase
VTNRVLLTGAAGRLGTVLSTGLAARDLQLRLTDRVPPPTLAPTSPYRRCDLANLEDVIQVADGVDTIVHAAGVPDEAPFAALNESNIVATFNVFEAARLSGVRRIVYASSAHVIGMYPPTYTVTSDTPPAPDTLYAATKLFGESLGDLYSAKHGLSVVNIRIGSFRPAPENSRQLHTWLSHRDATALFDRAIRADVEGVLTVYGVSNNSRSYWPRDGAEALGFVPRDSADDYDGRVPIDPSAAQWQGGVFASRDYAGGAG